MMAGTISDGDVLWANREDTARVVVFTDPEPDAPEDDAAMPTLQIQRLLGLVSTPRQVMGNQEHGVDVARVWRHCMARWRVPQALDVFTRYLCVYHGTTTVYDYGPNQATDNTYFTFDTAAWRESTGVAEDNPRTADESFAEYEAYLTGQVWGLALEHKVRRLSRTTDLYHGEITDWTEDDEWVHQDSVWDIYGSDRDWALQLAGEHFDIPTAEEGRAA